METPMSRLPLILTAISTTLASCASPDRPLPMGEVTCLSGTNARIAISMESTHPYFALLERAEIAALTGEPVDATDIKECRKIARQRFWDAALDFTDAEEAAVHDLVREIRDAIDEDFPLVSRTPWQFVKAQKTLCGGFSHTRWGTIILSEERVRGLAALSNDENPARERRRYAKLFVHEKLHILQRGSRDFEELYQKLFRWKRGSIGDHRWLRERQITNPDGTDLGWLYPVTDRNGKTRYWWPRTILATTEGVPRMGHDFLGRVIELELTDGISYRVIARDTDSPPENALELDEFSPRTARFPVRRGLAHPNEISAYLFADLVDERYLPPIPNAEPRSRTPEQQELFDAFHEWCKEHLRFPSS